MQDKAVWLQQFLKPKTYPMYLSAGMIALGAFFWIRDVTSIYGILLLLFFLFSALLYAMPTAKKLSEWRSFFDSTDEIAMQEISEDIVKSAMLRRNLYAGSIYIFGQYGVRVHRYSNITWTYLRIHKTNGITDKKEIIVVTTNGFYTLCELDVRDTTDDEIMRIFAVLKAKNPSVLIGYRPKISIDKIRKQI